MQRNDHIAFMCRKMLDSRVDQARPMFVAASAGEPSRGTHLDVIFPMASDPGQESEKLLEWNRLNIFRAM